MAGVGLYLSGAGSLDGSDAISTVLAYGALQKCGREPIPVGRDVDQGRVVDHRTAQTMNESRNALSEAARLVRGNIRDMRDVDAGELQAAVLVGGDGMLSTWTDYHDRGAECRITERLKYQILDLHKNDKPIVCLGNAGFVVAHVFRDRESTPRLNVGSNATLNETLRDWGIRLTDTDPAWDATHRVGCLPGVTREDDLPRSQDRLTDFLEARL